MTTPWLPASRGTPPCAHPRKLLTEIEAAEVLAISPRTLWDLRARGDIPCVRIGRSVRYAADDLDAWINDRKTVQAEEE